MKFHFNKRVFYLTLLLAACLLVLLCATQTAAQEEEEVQAAPAAEKVDSGKCSIQPKEGDACYGKDQDTADAFEEEEADEEGHPEGFQATETEAPAPEVTPAPADEVAAAEEEAPEPTPAPAVEATEAPKEEPAAAVEVEVAEEEQDEQEEEAEADAAADAADLQGEETAEQQQQEQEEEEEVPHRQPKINLAKEAKLRQEAEARMYSQEAHQAEEQRLHPEKKFGETAASIQMRARIHPDGCVRLTKKYYAARRGRDPLVQKVRDTRAAYNEAVARTPKDAPKFEKELAKVQQELEAYDLKVLQTYGGDLTRTCIEEVQDELESIEFPDTDNVYIGQFYQFYVLIRAHVRILELTGRGLYEHLLEHRFRPAHEKLTTIRKAYEEKANNVYTSAGPTEDPLTLTQLAVKYYAYVSVPYLVLTCAGALILIFFPYLLIDVVVRMFFINLWARVLLYFFLGFTSLRAYVGAVKEVVLLLVTGDFMTALNRFIGGFLDMMMDHLNFFNFTILLLVISFVLFVLFILVRIWLCFFIYPLLRTRKTKKAHK